MSGEVSYDVYVKKGVDETGRDEFGDAAAHFVERSNAVALKRRLVARREKVCIERSVVHGLSSEEKERWYSDYSRVPEYEPLRDLMSPQREPVGSKKAAEKLESAEPRPAAGDTQESAEPRSWWRRVLGG